MSVTTHTVRRVHYVSVEPLVVNVVEITTTVRKVAGPFSTVGAAQRWLDRPRQELFGDG